jgi:hypothetical protein
VCDIRKGHFVDLKMGLENSSENHELRRDWKLKMLFPEVPWVKISGLNTLPVEKARLEPSKMYLPREIIISIYIWL